MKLSNFILLACIFANAFGVPDLHAQAERLRVAMASISTSQVNLWVPRDIGLFKKHGLDVDLVLISGAPIVNAALLSGEVAIAQGGPAPSIQTNLKGAGTYIILGNTNRFPYQLVATPNTKDITDLKGRRFAIARLGAADHTAVLFVLPEARPTSGKGPESDRSGRRAEPFRGIGQRRGRGNSVDTAGNQ